MTDPLVRAARAYVERLGFALVVQDTDKVPVRRFFPRGVSSATKNVEWIADALRATPGALLAARVGKGLVLDVDVRHGGEEQLASLLARFGAFPPTWVQRTPSGGWHIWFSGAGVPAETRGKLATGVEVLRGNRLVTLSPSSRNGGRYRWEHHPLKTPLAEPPQWLVNAIELPATPKRTTTSEVDVETREKRARSYMQHFDGAVSGNHGHARTILAAVLVVRGFDLDEERALSVLTDWNRNCQPPWSERELRRKVRDAIRRGRMEWGEMLTRERKAA